MLCCWGFFLCRKLLSVLQGSLFALERTVAVKNSLGRREKKREGVILPLLQPLNHICSTDPRCHCRIKCGGARLCADLVLHCTHTEKSAARTIKSRPSAGAPYLEKRAYSETLGEINCLVIIFGQVIQY